MWRDGLAGNSGYRASDAPHAVMYPSGIVVVFSNDGLRYTSVTTSALIINALVVDLALSNLNFA